MAGALKDLLVGDSPAMVAVRERVAAAIEADLPVLLEGERGSGRERVERVLHQAGPRSARPFVRLHRTKLDHDLAEAQGGTLLVKEIARVGRGPQKKLSRVAKRRGESDVRLVAATQIDLGRAVADELFDSELYERLAPLRIVLPPLRQRPEDVPPLAARFARDVAETLGRARVTVAARALDRLVAYPWPGNVAELRDVVGRCAFRARRATIDLPEVEAELPRCAERAPLEKLSFEEMVRAKIRQLLDKMADYPVEDLYEEVIARVERPLIELTLAQAGGNQLRAARILGLNRNTLRKKIAERNVKTR